MGDNALLLVVITVIWSVPLCWLGVLGIRETVDWWHRRHQHGTHHPRVPSARMVWEIHQRLEREAARRVPRRSIAVHPIAVRPAEDPPFGGRRDCFVPPGGNSTAR